MLIHGHGVVRAGMRALLDAWPEMDVVAEAGAGPESPACAAREKPEVILVDQETVLRNGSSQLVRDLIEAAPEASIILMASEGGSRPKEEPAMEGIAGVVPREKGAEGLRQAILRVHSGRSLPQRTAPPAGAPSAGCEGLPPPADPEKAAIESLTVRELEVAALIGEGLKNKEIAARLSITETTVRHHMSSIFGKLQLGSRFELLIFLYRHKILPPPS